MVFNASYSAVLSKILRVTDTRTAYYIIMPICFAFMCTVFDRYLRAGRTAATLSGMILGVLSSLLASQAAAVATLGADQYAHFFLLQGIEISIRVFALLAVVLGGWLIGAIAGLIRYSLRERIERIA